MIRIAHLDETKPIDTPDFSGGEEPWVVFVDSSQLDEYALLLGLDAGGLESIRRGGMTRYEYHEGYDLIHLHIPGEVEHSRAPVRITVFWREGLLVFIDSNAGAISAMKQRSAAIERSDRLSQVVYRFLELLTGDDLMALEKIEGQISALEKELIESEDKQCVRQIVAFRARLLSLKRYYDHLRIVCEELENNESHLVNPHDGRYYHMLTSKVSRLYQSVITLSEYVSQVRETYQEQVDIGLNRVMKLFTVIAAIFMPLTLIAGWYGMNLKMPEYAWSWGYPFVIALSVAVTAVTILLFIRHKWF